MILLLYGVLKDVSSLFYSLVPEGSFLGSPIDQLLEQLEVFSKFQEGPEFALA